MSQVLFILKKREDYNAKIHYDVGLSTGLYNSASFVNDMLNDLDVSSRLEIAIDANCIDRLVTKNRPCTVIIEALWCPPSKIVELSRLHPKIKWILRLHSDTPFIANEGIAMKWIAEYCVQNNVLVAVNSLKMINDMRIYLKYAFDFNKKTLSEKCIYLPNFYPQNYIKNKFNYDLEYINISCFGAIRPLKNHLIQALAAIEFAEKINKKLRFHVNSNRIEMKGEPVLRNLQDLFFEMTLNGHEMINHIWTPRNMFLETCFGMDIGMQVSFSETFNIVSADLISQGVPVIGSSQIPWLPKSLHTDPTDINSIVDSLMRVYKYPKFNTWLTQRSLTKYTNNVKNDWLNHFDHDFKFFH
jgi:hypothetical protein